MIYRKDCVAQRRRTIHKTKPTSFRRCWSTWRVNEGEALDRLVEQWTKHPSACFQIDKEKTQTITTTWTFHFTPLHITLFLLSPSAYLSPSYLRLLQRSYELRLRIRYLHKPSGLRKHLHRNLLRLLDQDGRRTSQSCFEETHRGWCSPAGDMAEDVDVESGAQTSPVATALT